jgi:type I restriction enzyme, R subunit
MRQAIEEGFIMDVLENYTTYKRYFGLIKQVEDDPEVPRKQGRPALARFMELHPHNIEQVVEVIVEHFRLNTSHELGGRAKAMVVTGSRLHAVRYKLGLRPLHQGPRLSPASARWSPSPAASRPEDFPARPTPKSHERRHPKANCPRPSSATITGCCWWRRSTRPASTSRCCRPCMWSSGWPACRRCRRSPASTAWPRARRDTFVLDFVNEERDLQAFKPYYEVTPAVRTADPHQLYDLQHRLEGPDLHSRRSQCLRRGLVQEPQ